MDIRLKEVLTNLRNYDFDILGNYKMDKSEANKMIRALEYLESGGWIPCKERLPEENKDVLVTVHVNGEIDFYIEVASHIDGKWFSYSDEYKIDRQKHKVIAWQPLPKPFKESEKKDGSKN